MNFLCIGPVLCDIAMKDINPSDFDNGRTVLNSFEILGGGDANNASIDLAILGETVRPVGVLGQDFLGDRLICLLQEKGVDTSYLIQKEDLPTTVSILMMGSEGDTTLNVMRHGSNESFAPGIVTDEMIAWADHVHLVSAMNLHAFDGDGAAEVFRKAHEMGKTTSMDLKKRIAPLEDRMSLVKGPLANCDVFLPSHYEVEYLCGLTDPTEAAEFFRPYGLKVFGCKMGAKGVYLTDYKEEIYQPTLYRGVPVDVIGAGDAFSSTFACAWKRGYCLKECGVIASAASACVVGSFGSTTGMRDFDSLVEFAKERGAM